jgi:hypothetical protein
LQARNTKAGASSRGCPALLIGVMPLPKSLTCAPGTRTESFRLLHRPQAQLVMVALMATEKGGGHPGTCREGERPLLPDTAARHHAFAKGFHPRTGRENRPRVCKQTQVIRTGFWEARSCYPSSSVGPWMCKTALEKPVRNISGTKSSPQSSQEQQLARLPGSVNQRNDLLKSYFCKAGSRMV